MKAPDHHEARVPSLSKQRCALLDALGWCEEAVEVIFVRVETDMKLPVSRRQLVAVGHEKRVWSFGEEVVARMQDN